MDEEPSTVVGLLAGSGLILALVTLAFTWWSITAGGSDIGARPFDAGQAGGDLVSEGGVIAVGVLVLAGVAATAGGLVLWLRAIQEDQPPVAPAPWLHLAGGALLLMGPLVAVATWPQSGVGFWDTVGGSVSTAAGIGWYLALVAGALVGAAGVLGLGPSESAEPDL